jgi:hypothetical protein
MPVIVRPVQSAGGSIQIAGGIIKLAKATDAGNCGGFFDNAINQINVGASVTGQTTDFGPDCSTTGCAARQVNESLAFTWLLIDGPTTPEEEWPFTEAQGGNPQMRTGYWNTPCSPPGLAIAIWHTGADRYPTSLGDGHGFGGTNCLRPFPTDNTTSPPSVYVDATLPGIGANVFEVFFGFSFVPGSGWKFVVSGFYLVNCVRQAISGPGGGGGDHSNAVPAFSWGDETVYVDHPDELMGSHGFSHNMADTVNVSGDSGYSYDYEMAVTVGIS